MHEVSQRWALTMSVSAAIAGIVALVLGAFFSPIPSTHVDATTFVTAIFIRGILSLVALAAACILAYVAGFRIEKQLGPSDADPSPAVASSPLVAMFTTPGPRRDAIYTGMLILTAYWFFTTIYIAALGNKLGDMGITASTVGSFIVGRLLLGLALAIAGAGAGGLGARNAAARRITQAAFTAAAPEVTPPTDPTTSREGA